MKIGIVGWRTSDAAYGVTNTYLEFAQQFGKPQILMPQGIEEEIEKVDAVILPGGLDINPSSYGEAPAFATSSTDVFKQYFFDNILDKYIDNKVPVFGICLGFQQLNAYFGGTLLQHMRSHDNSSGRWVKGHEVHFENLKPLGMDFKKQDVNSHHHQAVTRSRLSTELVPLAHIKNKDSENDDIIEAFIHRELPIAGVQWHPEEWYDNFAIDLFNKILK